MAEHVLYLCPPGKHHEDLRYCQYCDGGLAFCTVCKGGEAELPHECPGREMTEQERDDVMCRRRDYCDGEWVTVREPHRG